MWWQDISRNVLKHDVWSLKSPLCVILLRIFEKKSPHIFWLGEDDDHPGEELAELPEEQKKTAATKAVWGAKSFYRRPSYWGATEKRCWLQKKYPWFNTYVCVSLLIHSKRYDSRDFKDSFASDTLYIIMSYHYVCVCE